MPYLRQQNPSDKVEEISHDKQIDEQGKEEDIFELDEDTLKIIGEEPPQGQKEHNIHASLVNRWNPWLQEGLKKEVRDELLTKYPRAGNCLLEPPILNPELGTLNPNIIKKDKYFTFTQNLAGSALTALAPVISEIVALKTTESRKMLEKWDAARLVAELHHSQTVARKACILPSVSKQIAERLSKNKTTKYLFGDDLGEKIKEIKMINKMGQDIKLQTPRTLSNTLTSNPSNWRGPSTSQRSATQTGRKALRPQQLRKPTSTTVTTLPRKSSHYRAQAPKSRYR